ncbi:hypothetical protein J1N35_001644 [Gossypium stocksii]|uniref:Uncharacterized protein n=1 Tax=Gossypium stocksii TaxID=47602 RepID=A0A9D3WKV9_9ROSI|nr:hypothetical protein J1N35_001644 [Gossypium stocksii]
MIRIIFIPPGAPSRSTISDGPPEARPNNYQTAERGARHHRQRHPDRYTPALGSSPGSQQF